MALPVLILLFSFSGCRSANVSTGKKSIVVTYSILGSIVKDLVGDKANVTVSIPNGLDPHEWEPSAKDIETINKADLVIQNGLGLEGGLEKTLEAGGKQWSKIFHGFGLYYRPACRAGRGNSFRRPRPGHRRRRPASLDGPFSDEKCGQLLWLSNLKKDFNLDVASQATNLENQLDTLKQTGHGYCIGYSSGRPQAGYRT